jgi:hypothetical protein
MATEETKQQSDQLKEAAIIRGFACCCSGGSCLPLIIAAFIMILIVTVFTHFVEGFKGLIPGT